MKNDAILIFLLILLTHNKTLDLLTERFVIHLMLLIQVSISRSTQKKSNETLSPHFCFAEIQNREIFSTFNKLGWGRAKSKIEEKISLFWGAPQGARGAARDWLRQSPALSPKARGFLLLRIFAKMGSSKGEYLSAD